MFNRIIVFSQQQVPGFCRPYLRKGLMLMHIMWLKHSLNPLALTLLLTLAFTSLFAAESAPPSPAGQWEAGDAYDHALRNAEKELKDYGKGNGDAAGGWSLSAVLSLVALLLAIGLAVWATRWMRGNSLLRPSGREMRIVDRMAVGKQSSLLIVRIREKDYWLAEHASGITLLAEWPSSGADDSRPAPSRSGTPFESVGVSAAEPGPIQSHKHPQ